MFAKKTKQKILERVLFMKKFTPVQEKYIAEIISFYDRPWLARMIINEAADNHNFSSDSNTQSFLETERAKFEKRKKAGVKGFENILRSTLNLLPDTRKSGVGFATSGFNFLQWQERDGGFW